MNFKELMKNDLAVFFNPDELGDSFTWDGIPVDGTISNLTEEESYKKYGTNKVSKEVELPIDSIEKPELGQRIDLSGEVYSVEAIDTEVVVYKIGLGAFY